MKFVDNVLIVSITPYFLEKGRFWLEQNAQSILRARHAQSFFEDNTIYLEKNQVCSLSQLLRKLDEMSYEKVLQVQEPGEFASRGGILDVFPICCDSAIRIEFFGNRVQELSELPLKVADEEKAREVLKKRLRTQKLFSDLKGLKAGDYLVHLDHGVGRFTGLTEENVNDTNYKGGSRSSASSPSANKSERSSAELSLPPKIQNTPKGREATATGQARYYVLEYAAGDKLYVPVGLERKLSRYIGFTEPKISRLGAYAWQKMKKRAREDTEELAKELLEIYAKRETVQRQPYTAENEIDLHLAATFPYQETPDQLEAIEHVMRDLEKAEPMDRLIVGDVGFGKTEIALRAMVKAVNSNWQAALICPTTILANQHYQNFKERLKHLPLKVSLLSRLQTKKEQKEIVEELKTGKVDIVIGTHRVLSKDVEFKRLGLLVIDDEQRFGVAQKERLKQARASLDVLSLSATPIPRTLYMALSSLRSVSLVQTPPENRLPVKTFILPFSEKTIKKAIESELQRGGQVYYLHNRITTISFARELLGNLVSKARFGVAHGRLKEKELIKVMDDFRRKKTDVLIATTIIENGLDLENVNTIIVEDSTKLGLSQAYQIRGRIGRSNLQAQAFFLYPKKLSQKVYPVRSRKLSNGAKLRLAALKEAEALGSGYRLAQKDLQMRGAGNILGKEQSGSVNRVGLNLYCQMLSDAVERIKQRSSVNPVS